MPQPHHFAQTTVWTGSEVGPTESYATYSRAFRVDVAGKPWIEGSAAGAFRGDETRLNPEDLLIAAVSSCHMLSYLAECSRKGISVISYVDTTTATMAFRDGKMRITEVTLRPKVLIAAGNDLELAESLHARAHEECFIANSVNFPIEHFAEVEFSQ
jgi:organic hydroperoxide reductase OsmC/OhrA